MAIRAPWDVDDMSTLIAGFSLASVNISYWWAIDGMARLQQCGPMGWRLYQVNAYLWLISKPGRCRSYVPGGQTPPSANIIVR
jgi:hypothetical protein